MEGQKTKKGKTQAKASEKEVDSQPKASESVGEKRTSSGAVATDGRSPLREATPVLRAKAKASSAPAAVVAVEALAEKIPIRKKKVEFLNQFPGGYWQCRPGNQFSDDDDDESIAFEESEISLVKDKNASYYEQLDPEAFGGEDCPFFSNLIWPNCSTVNFGLAVDMHPIFFQETGRRICIY